MGKTAAVLIAGLIFGGVFAMAASFKFFGMGTTADYIAAAGFPLALPLASIAAFFSGMANLLAISFTAGRLRPHLGIGMVQQISTIPLIASAPWP